jgi:hypothetical protein
VTRPLKPKARRRGRALLTAAVGMAAVGLGLTACGKCNGFCGAYGVEIDCDGGDRGTPECNLLPDGGSPDGG